MKIFIIGSTHYQDKMFSHACDLKNDGHEVKLPFFDIDFDNELIICQENIKLIKWADEVHVFWNQRTTGTILDVGAVIALDKPLRIIYMERKTLAGVMEKYVEATI